MKLRQKILWGYGIALGLILFVGGWGIFNLRRLGRASNAIVEENYRSIIAAEKKIDALERQDSAILLALLGNEEQARGQFREAEFRFLQAFANSKSNVTIEGEAEIIEALEATYNDYLKAVRFSTITIQSYDEEVFPLFESVRDLCVDLRELNSETMLDAADRTRWLSIQATWSMAIAGGGAAGLGLIFSLLLSDRLVKPLRKMTEATESIADGNYNVALPVTSQDELGILATAINSMSEKLQSFRDLNVGKIINEQQRSEAIISSIADGIIVVDDQLKVIALNPAAGEIVKVKPILAVDNHFLDVFNNQKFYQYLQETITTGKALNLKESENVLTLNRGETTQYYQFQINPVINKNKQTLGGIVLLQDITKLRELDRLKSDFVDTASHELRTPLTGMAMSLSMLQEMAESKLSDSEMELVTTANEDVARLSSLVNDLLDLSKIESGRIDLDFVPLDVEFLFSKAIATLKVQAEDKQISLHSKLPNPVKVRADPNKILWVLTNLIANAIRYTQTGGEINLRAKQHQEQLYISVQDNGAGIPREYTSKIFDKFVQVENQESLGGSGLGLAICKEIVKAHGGTIWVDSIFGEGSTFTFTLPIVNEQLINN
ncbi:HAMP domain-containing protein [Waterburya agarophytonicola K14]|uniref:histidine kinase n=1 Tax=Waterburya agarophytonicola KI4 TaxID=2874699 RepID=A0A964BRU3_9CYAN|nr:ATP-binding protein [Waterburya agarophytonicola]MCC0178305.1 HAMP domain-containing protein [Waterburya agarophytonicola KI4]